eukprot:scaffold93814_cov31-Tisochrysis_lutea.AAC.1
MAASELCNEGDSATHPAVSLLLQEAFLSRSPIGRGRVHGETGCERACRIPSGELDTRFPAGVWLERDRGMGRCGRRPVRENSGRVPIVTTAGGAATGGLLLNLIEPRLTHLLGLLVHIDARPAHLRRAIVARALGHGPALDGLPTERALRRTLADGDDATLVQPLDVQLWKDEVAKLKKRNAARTPLICKMEESARLRGSVLHPQALAKCTKLEIVQVARIVGISVLKELLNSRQRDVPVNALALDLRGQSGDMREGDRDWGKWWW